MKWQEEGYGSRQQAADTLSDLVRRLAEGSLTVEGQEVRVPEDGLEYKIKYSDDQAEGELSFKVTWTQ